MDLSSPRTPSPQSDLLGLRAKPLATQTGNMHERSANTWRGDITAHDGGQARAGLLVFMSCLIWVCQSPFYYPVGQSS